MSKDNDEDTADNAYDTGQHMMLLKNCTNYLSPAKNEEEEAKVFPQNEIISDITFCCLYRIIVSDSLYQVGWDGKEWNGVACLDRDVAKRATPAAKGSFY
ncbi:hypothetical protein ACLKA7_008958 [Drosophila subpalustris]